MNNDYILVAAPNSYHKNYMADRYFSLVKNLSHKNYDLFFADNSPDNCNKGMYEDFGIPYAWINPKGKNSFQFIWESQNAIRNYFLDNPKYTHLCFIETDLTPPVWILDYLAAHRKPVVGCPYFIYKGEESLLMNQEIDTLYTAGNTRNYSLEESFMQMNGKPNKAFSIGWGCCMIERWIIARYLFRFQNDGRVRNEAGKPAHTDSFFYGDLFFDGIEPMLDTSLVIPHYNQDWMHLNIKDTV